MGCTKYAWDWLCISCGAKQDLLYFSAILGKNKQMLDLESLLLGVKKLQAGGGSSRLEVEE